jgi:hypothetical protein
VTGTQVKIRVMVRLMDLPGTTLKECACLVKDEAAPNCQDMLAGFSTLGKSTPVFIADAVGDGDVWKLGHHCPGRGVHELEGSLVVWLLKGILAREPGAWSDR